MYNVVSIYLRNHNSINKCIDTFEDLLDNPFFYIHRDMILYYLAVWYLKVKNKVKLKESLISIWNLKYHPKNCFGEYYFKGLLLCADSLMNKEKLKPA